MRKQFLALRVALSLAILLGICPISAGAENWHTQSLEQRNEEISKLYESFQKSPSLYKVDSRLCPAVQFVRQLADELKKPGLEQINKKKYREMILDIIENGTGVGGISNDRQASSEEADELTQAICMTTFMEIKDEKFSAFGTKKNECLGIIAGLDNTAQKTDKKIADSVKAHKEKVKTLVSQSYDLMGVAFSFSFDDFMQNNRVFQLWKTGMENPAYAHLIKPMRSVAERLRQTSEPISFAAHTDTFPLLPILSFGGFDKVRKGIEDFKDKQRTKGQSEVLDSFRKDPIQKSWVYYWVSLILWQSQSQQEASELAVPPNFFEDMPSQKFVESLEYLYCLSKKKMAFLSSAGIQKILKDMENYWKPSALLLIYWMSPDQLAFFKTHKDDDYEALAFEWVNYGHLLKGMKPYNRLNSLLSLSKMSDDHRKFLSILIQSGFFNYMPESKDTETNDQTGILHKHEACGDKMWILSYLSDISPEELDLLNDLNQINFFQGMNGLQKNSSLSSICRPKKDTDSKQLEERRQELGFLKQLITKTEIRNINGEQKKQVLQRLHITSIYVLKFLNSHPEFFDDMDPTQIVTSIESMSKIGGMYPTWIPFLEKNFTTLMNMTPAYRSAFLPTLWETVSENDLENRLQELTA